MPLGKLLDGLIVTCAFEIDTLPEDTAIVSMVLPDALPFFKVILPLPLIRGALYVITILSPMAFPLIHQ